jgi:membrane-anchored protein YejM (alkaline phosphatase superfamily)
MYDPMKYLKTNQSYEDTIWSDVATEIKIYGAFAQSLDHLTISEWTAITYAVSAGLLLALLVAAKLFRLNQIQPTSKFSIVDFAILENSVRITKRQADGIELETGILSIFEGCEAGYDKLILSSTAAVKLSWR